MVDNNENIYVEFDCNNITLVNPNKVIDSEGKVKDRVVRHENLVMYANLQCKVLPRTKLLAGGDGQTSVETITVAEINFLNPGNKEFMDNSYTDQLTGKDSLKGKGENQHLTDKGKKFVGSGGVKDKIVNNGLLGITNITINQGLDFLPVITMDLTDVQGKSMFELGNNSPYAAFFNLPYPMFELTIKGYYGKAVKLKLMLQNFSSRYSDSTGDFNISLKFYTYKYTLLTELPMGALLAVPHMYSSRLKITKTTGGNTSKVTDGVVELGYQKIKEMYNEYKSKGLLPKDFPEITLLQMRDRIDNFVKNILDSFTKQNLEPLNDIDTYGTILSDYQKKIDANVQSWRSDNIDMEYFLVLKNDKSRVFTFKKSINDDLQKRQSAIEGLSSIINGFAEKLLANKTFGKGGEYTINNKRVSSEIPNPITLKTFNNRSIDESQIDYLETYRAVKKIAKEPTTEELELFKNELKNRKLLNFTDIVINGKTVLKTDYFIFDGDKSFNDEITKMEKLLNDYRLSIQSSLTEALSSLLQSKDNGIGFVPTIRNVLAVFFASGEAFLRLMDDVHTKAWDVRDENIRKNAILTKIAGVAGQDNISSGVNDDTPIYPWPQYIIQTDGSKGHEKYEIAYPGDPKYVSSTKGYRYDVWPEVEFLEEFIKGLVKKNVEPEVPSEGGNLLNDIRRVSFNTIEYPISNDIFSNKEEVKYFYEIYERVLLHSNYPLFSRVMDIPNSIDSIIGLFAEREKENILNSLSTDNPFLIKKIKSYGINSVNFIDVLRNISNGGSGLSWQNYIRGIYNTSYINNLTTNYENGFVSPSVINSTKGQPLVGVSSEEQMVKYLNSTSNDFNFIDTFPFTNLEWDKINMANGKLVNNENAIFNTTNVLTYNTNKKTITNFLETDNDNIKRPFTKNLTGSVVVPTINDGTLNYFYRSRDFKSQFLTEGNIRYGSYSGNVSSDQSVSMLNTPYFVNAIQKGVDKFRNYDSYPFTEAAFLFLNSLPIATLKENYKTFNDDGSVTELNYIASTLKKYGALHKLPYSFILKYGSIWYRYKKFINDGVDILSDVWKDFDSAANYDPITSAKTKNYNITINNRSIDFYLEKNTTIGTDSTTLMNVGFYPKLINDFNVFYQGYELFSTYTSTDITNSISSGLTFNYIPEAIVNLNEGFDTKNLKRDLKIIPWTMTVNSLDNTSTFILPSEGSFINQSKNECLTNDGKLKIELSGNTSVYNGSVRLFWSAPNYGYYDNSQVVMPTPKQYFKKIITDSTEQENYSLNGGGYSYIEELFSVFDKKTLDSFEEEFLLFSKSMYDYESSSVLDPKDDEHKLGNFQMLMVDMMKLQKITGETSTEFLTQVQTIQLERITSSIKNFINKDVYFKFGNPSRFNKRTFYPFSQRSMVDMFNWNSYSAYSPNALPSSTNGVTLLQSKTNYPNEWKVLETYIGFSTIDELVYSDNGSYITDFFIDNDVEFTENNIIQLQQIIRIYATQKNKKSVYGRVQFIIDMENYLTKNDSFMDKVIDNLMIKIQKDLPDISNTPLSSTTTELEGKQTKVELWESFKAMNDKWIAGGDFKFKTLFEDVLLVDRASRDIGDKILVDIYKLKTLLYDINAQSSMYYYVDELIRTNNFTISNLPSYVNFYNVQDVTKNQTPKPDGTTDFANNLFGTFMNVDTRQSSPKLLCIYANKVSEQLAVDTDLTKRNDDAFEMDCGSPIIENQVDKKDWGTSNKIAAFNVDIGIQNQSIFYRLSLDQNNSLSTAESLQLITQMANQAGNRKGATQNVSLYNLYKIRSYTTSFSMLGNAMIQPSMYFNLRYVPMFSGPYMITSVQHVITPGNFETSVTGVRQPTASLPKVDEYIQVLKTNLLESIIKKNKENVAAKKNETKDSKNNVNSQKDKIAAMANSEGRKELTENCTAKLPYDKFFNTTDPSTSTLSFKSVKDIINQALSIIPINDDGKLKYVIFATLYIESGKDNGFTAYENNFAGIDLSSNWGGSIKPYIKQQFFCLTNDKTTLPYAEFKDTYSLIEFLSIRWKDRMKGVEVTPKSIAKFWIENLSSNKTPSNVYDSFDKTKLSNLEAKIEKSIQTYNAI